MKRFLLRSTALVVSVAAITLAAGATRAEAASSNGYTFGLALTIGEGVYFVHKSAYRGPVSLEAVPSFGWSWFKFDLGVSTTLESVRIAGSKLGYWNWTFRPGGRITPPMIPLYLRVAFPLQIQRHDFDYGVMFGVGADIPVFGFLGVVLEIDTTLSKHLSWGGDGVPLEFRAGVSFHF